MLHHDKRRLAFGEGHYATKNVRKIKQAMNDNDYFNVIDKKNNQTSVSDADRQIPILGPTDNAINSVNLVSGIFPFTLGLGFLGLHR